MYSSTTVIVLKVIYSSVDDIFTIYESEISGMLCIVFPYHNKIFIASFNFLLSLCYMKPIFPVTFALFLSYKNYSVYGKLNLVNISCVSFVIIVY